MAIPRFPTFRRLEIADRAAIETKTRRFPPYSDFGFTSLWAWDTDETCAISMLGGNLVVRLQDYRTEECVFSFLGQDAVGATVGALLAHARREGLPVQLRLVPEAVIAADEGVRRRYAVALDRDNFDYVYAVEAWAHFLHPGFREHRRKLARCRECAALDCRLLDAGDSAVQGAMLALFDRWAAQKPALAGEDRQRERTALERVFVLAGGDRLEAGGFYDGERLVGFSIWEGLPGGEWAVIHFQKADRAYRGLSSWQAQELGRLLLTRGYRLINFEQDLGIPGLGEFKRSLQPCRFLRKYVVAERADEGDERDSAA
jgi:hypothetical protein